MKTFSILTTLVLAAHPLFALAADCITTAETQDSTDVIISELYPAPGSGEEEFIELYNSGSTAVILTGWLLSDESEKQYTLPNGTTLNAGQYLALYNSTTGITLNNSGDVVTLYNAAGEVRSSVEYASSESQQSWSLTGTDWTWATPTSGQTNTDTSETRTTDDSDSSSEEDSASETGANNDDENDETSPDIHVNELLPNPNGLDSTDEWIELVNSGDTAVSLRNWQLTDQSNYYTIGDVAIGAGEYLVFEIGDTGISLNNTGDTVYIIDPFGSILEGTEYTNSVDGEAWARNGDTWEWTTTPTPGEENVFNSETTEGTEGEGGAESSANTNSEGTQDEQNSVSISAFRSLEDGESATIEGVVTVIPGVFGSQYFYIQDDGAGIQIYSYSKTFPELSEGDRIRVTGEKSTSHNETRIKISEEEDIVVVEQGVNTEPQDATTLGEEVEGVLIHIEGEVVDRSSSTVTIDDAIAVVIKTDTGISASSFMVGTTVSIIGIISQYDDSYRLMPRSTDDITTVSEEESAWIQPAQAATGKTITNETESPDTQNSLLIIGLVIATGCVLAVRYFLWHRKQQLAKITTPAEPE